MPASPALAPLLTEEMPPWRFYFGLAGRIDRRSFWLRGLLALFVLSIVGAALLEIAGLRADRVERLINLLIAWPAIAISVKRWHDRDRPGRWVLIAVVPLALLWLAQWGSQGAKAGGWLMPLVLLSFVGQLWMLIDNGFVPGTKGPNRFGEPPRD